MSYITSIFDRLDIQQIREFLLHGVECMEIDHQSYKDRIDALEKPFFRKMAKIFPDPIELDAVAAEFHQYSGAVRNVYMEIGIQCGFAIATQLITRQDRV